MSSLFHSIRWRVQVWHAVLLLGVILAFCGAIYRLAWTNQLRRADRAIMQAERTLIRSLVEALPPSPLTGKPEPFSPARVMEYLRGPHPVIPAAAASLFNGTEPGYTYFVFRDVDGRILLRSPNLPADLVGQPLSPEAFNDDWRTLGDRRETIHRNPEGITSIVGADLTPEREEMKRFVLSLAGTGLAIWALGLLGGWWLAGRAIRPIQKISRTATRIAEGNLAERIGTTVGDSELDQLGRVLDTTFDRLHTAIERQKQFTADASHELKTPVTILLAETQRALKRERSPEEYRAALATCQTAAERMRRLTESLLLLARQEAGADAPRERCDLSALLRDTVAHLRPLAAERQLTVEADLRPAVCLGDPAALSILASNLVANALQHHDRAGGIVRVACTTTAEGVTLTVVDDGPGIPPAHLPHLFERFYRADAARTGGAGHTGLGLAIARAIVQNHGGTLTAANEPGRGARFTARLPAA